MDELAKGLTEWMEAVGWSTRDVQEASEGALTGESVRTYAKGEKRPGADKLKVLFALGCNVHRLLGDRREPLFSDTPKGRFWQWLLASPYKDPKSLLIAARDEADRKEIAKWLRTWAPPTPAMSTVLERLGLNRRWLESGEGGSMFSDTAEGRAQERQADAAAPPVEDRNSGGGESTEKTLLTSKQWTFLDVGPENPEVVNLSDPNDLLAFIAERTSELRGVLDRELETISDLARRGGARPAA